MRAVKRYDGKRFRIWLLWGPVGRVHLQDACSNGQGPTGSWLSVAKNEVNGSIHAQPHPASLEVDGTVRDKLLHPTACMGT